MWKCLQCGRNLTDICRFVVVGIGEPQGQGTTSVFGKLKFKRSIPLEMPTGNPPRSKKSMAIMIASFSSSTMFFIGGCRVFPLPRKSGSSMSYGYQSPRGHGIPLIYHNPSVYGGHVVVFEQVLYSKCLFTTSFPGPSNTNNRKWRQCSSVSSLPCL